MTDDDMIRSSFCMFASRACSIPFFHLMLSNPNPNININYTLH
jgi:hypothetical protein